MVATFRIIYPKFKIKTYLCVREAIHPLQSPILILIMNETFKIIKSKKLILNNQRSFNQIPIEINGFG